MKMLVMSFLLGSYAFAGSAVSLSCKATNPCQYAGKGLAHCIASITVAGRANGMGTEVIGFQPVKFGNTIKLAPQRSAVAIKVVANTIKFSSEDGDQWGDLQSAPGGRYVGHITVDQDFQFEVSCQDKSIGFE